MYDELTEVDIRKMQEEIDYRMHELRPELVRVLQEARSHGDLSENSEYKTAKQDLRHCDSRLRYLRRMIETAKVVKMDAPEGKVGLFDTVTLYFEDDDETETYRIVTTLREDALNNIISKESPLGRALMGHAVGDRVEVRASEQVHYFVRIEKVEKGVDDDTLPIHSF